MLNYLLMRQQDEQDNMKKRHVYEYADIVDHSMLTFNEFGFLSDLKDKLYSESGNEALEAA